MTTTNKKIYTQRNIDLAFVAGYLESRGHAEFRRIIQKRKIGTSTYSRFIFRTSSKDSTMLNFIKDTLGVGNVHGPYYTHSAKNPIFHYQVNIAEHVFKVVKILRPYLTHKTYEEFNTVCEQYRKFKEGSSS